MPAYSLSAVPCNEIHLRSGKIVEPVITEDVSSSEHKEEENSQQLFDSVPIIDKAGHPLEGTTEPSNVKGMDETPYDKTDDIQPS